MANFTQQYIQALKPDSSGLAKRHYEKGADKGFHLRVMPNGEKIFGIAWRVDGKQRFHQFGRLSSSYTLKMARQDCREARLLIDKGLDPRLERLRTEQQEETYRNQLELESNAPSINDVLDHYLKTLENERTRKNTTQQFKTDVRPFIGKIKAHQLSEVDAAAVINRVLKRGANRSARNLYIALNAAFNRARKNLEFNLKGWINPLEDVDKPKEGDPTDRALSIDELKVFWLALLEYKGMVESFKKVLQLLILTGQRVQDIIELEWAEVHIDNDTAYLDLTISRTKTGKKTRRGHIVPLPRMAKELIEGQPRFGKAVFPSKADPDKPLNWQSLTKALARMLKTTELSHFSPRDIRSTVKTHMARIKILKEIRDRIQNHALNDVASKHYDRHDYFDEKLDGLQRWQNELLKITNTDFTANAISTERQN